MTRKLNAWQRAGLTRIIHEASVDAAQMLPAVTAGQMAPVIDSRYPLSGVAAAHERMAANANAGKLVIDVR